MTRPYSSIEQTIIFYNVPPAVFRPLCNKLYPQHFIHHAILIEPSFVIYHFVIQQINCFLQYLRLADSSFFCKLTQFFSVSTRQRGLYFIRLFCNIPCICLFFCIVVFPLAHFVLFSSSAIIVHRYMYTRQLLFPLYRSFSRVVKLRFVCMDVCTILRYTISTTRTQVHTERKKHYEYRQTPRPCQSVQGSRPVN